MSSETGSGGTKPKEGFESSGSTKRAAAPSAGDDDNVSSSSFPRHKRRALFGNNDNEEDEKESGIRHAANSASWDDDYQGFPFSSSCLSAKNTVVEIDRITSASKLTSEAFFERYIAARRPCVLGQDSSLLFLATTGPSTSNSNKRNKLLTLQDLSSLDGAADSLICQVERRPNAQTPFGQNRTREYMQEMSLTKVIECLQDVNTRHLYYLSTQQEQEQDAFGNNSNDHDEATSAILPPTAAAAADFSPLTKKLVQAGLIQDHVPLAGNLILQSCQLWMGGRNSSGIGSSSSSSSSGLHHDFHDNFYILHAGRKRFTLYPPNAPIPVFGQRQCIHGNGLISYHSNPTRADGVPLSLLLLSHPRTASAAAINKNSDKESEEEDGEDDDEEEEVVLGKGFDYQSDTDDEDNADAAFDDEEAIVDDYDAMFGNDDDDESDEQPNGGDECNESKKKAAVAKSDIENGAKTKATSNETTRPDSFSPVNLSLDPKELHEAFPIMKTVQPIVVDIQAGECLYLPASWFHCVESFAADDHDDTSGNDMNNSGGVHMAVNYWYHPPDRLDHFPDPYKHDFWKRKTRRNMS